MCIAGLSIKTPKGFLMESWKRDEILDFQPGRLPGLPFK